uniref:V-SNARE coiled-coil homology domain-containing protein n=2 Tax=Onchocerca ochengi TaxID=42157 RepID=A0A182EY66_ONCOC
MIEKNAPSKISKQMQEKMDILHTEAGGKLAAIQMSNGDIEIDN